MNSEAIAMFLHITISAFIGLMIAFITESMTSNVALCCDVYDLGDLGKKRVSRQALQFFNLKKTATNNDLLIFAQKHPGQTSEYLSNNFFVENEDLTILTVLSSVVLLSANISFEDLEPTDSMKDDYTDLKYLPLKKRDKIQIK